MIRAICLSMFVSMLFIGSGKAETTECTVISSVPIIIDQQGIYCLKGNLSTDIASGAIINIQTNNVTIDMNGNKLGGLAAGLATDATGIFAISRKNITIRNGVIRGFQYGINLSGTSGHVVEDMLLDGNTSFGMSVGGTGAVIRNNRVVNTGGGENFTSAIGIELVSANGSLVVGNVVSEVNDEDDAVGISVSFSDTVEVRGNSVSNLSATSMKGIRVAVSSPATIDGNNVANPSSAQGTIGVEVFNSNGVICIDNLLAYFATDILGCAQEAGNITSP